MTVNFNAGVSSVDGLNIGSQSFAGVNEADLDQALLTLNTARTEGNEEEIADALAELQELLGTTNVTTTNASAKSEEIKEEIEKLEKEKEKNMAKMEKIEDHIEDLTEKAEDYIIKAAKEQEEAVKDHEEETQQVLDEQIKAYIAANKEGGKGMTRDELQANIAGAMPNVPQVAEAVAALTAASSLVDEIDVCLGELKNIMYDTQLIEQNIGAKQTEYDAALKAEEEAKACCPPPTTCDPIGFTMGEGENKAQYDFIVDDGAFDTTSDFLGAENQWAEMAALDTDGDNVVTADELKAGNIKAVKTDAAGNQTVVDLAEEFGEDFSVDLNSYAEGGSHSAIDTTADADGNGLADQQLLGTFNLNIGGESIQGYNTLDDVNFLEANYGVTSDVAADTEIEGNELEITSEDLQYHNNFFNLYTEKSEMLKEDIAMGYEQLGISKEQMAEMNEIAQVEADEQARAFFATLETEETEEEPAVELDAETAEEIEEKKEEEELELPEDEIAA